MAEPLAPPWSRPAAVGALAVAGTVLVAVVDPTTSHVPLCPFAALTGLDCVACGSLRAVHALTRGDLAGAVDHNALFVVLAPLAVLAWLAWLARTLDGRDRLGPVAGRLPRVVVPLVVAVGIAFGLVRNLPAFAYLAST